MKTEIKKAIKKVSEATEKTQKQIIDLLNNKDEWTWFLVSEAEKAL